MEAILSRCEELAGSASQRALLLEDAELLSGLALVAGSGEKSSEAALGLLLRLAESAEPQGLAQLRSVLRPVLGSLQNSPTLSKEQSGLLNRLSTRLSLSQPPLRALQTATNGAQVPAGPTKLGPPKLAAQRRFIGGGVSKALHFRLASPPTAELRRGLEKAIAGVTGVVSIYMEREKLTLRVRTATFTKEKLAEALGVFEELEMEQMGDGGCYEPFLLRPQPQSLEEEQAGWTSADQDLPDYLSDSFGSSPKADDKAVARADSEATQSRGRTPWISNLTSFLADNLFW